MTTLLNLYREMSTNHHEPIYDILPWLVTGSSRLVNKLSSSSSTAPGLPSRRSAVRA